MHYLGLITKAIKVQNRTKLSNRWGGGGGRLLTSPDMLLLAVVAAVVGGRVWPARPAPCLLSPLAA